MFIVTRSARRATRHVCGNGSLAVFKKNANRNYRRTVNVKLKSLTAEMWEDDSVNFMPTGRLVTAWEIC